MRADLHFHSTHSDGKHPVEWLVEHLQKETANGLKLAVLTDHDTTIGYSEYEAGLSKYFPIVRACELSVEASFKDKKRELHFLIFGIEEKDEFLAASFKQLKIDRETRFFRICEKLNAAGYSVDGEAFAKKHPGVVLGRPHVADALVESGVVQTRDEGFKRFLKEGSPFSVKKVCVPFEQAVAHCKKKNYRTALAHPGQYHLKEEHLSLAKDLGVTAIEVVHPRHSEGERQFYSEMARQFGFEKSGGSDFHSASTDLDRGLPSLGKAPYPYEEAKSFLKGLL